MGMIITDGMKTYNLKNPDSWGEWLANGSESVTATKLYNTVAMLNRCIRLRTDAAAHIPFASPVPAAVLAPDGRGDAVLECRVCVEEIQRI
jgi:hypothetical protein